MKREPFPELEEIINYLSSDEMQAQRIKTEKVIINLVWEMRFWESING